MAHLDNIHYKNIYVPTQWYTCSNFISLSIYFKVVSWNLVHGEVYLIQFYVTKVCQWLVAGRWFSPGSPVSSTNKTDYHDIIEILLKVALNTIALTLTQYLIKLFIKLIFNRWCLNKNEPLTCKSSIYFKFFFYHKYNQTNLYKSTHVKSKHLWQVIQFLQM